MFEEIVSDLSKNLSDNLIELLKFEEYIEIKKENNIDLTSEEKFYDDFLLKPSIMTKMILHRIEKKESE